MKIVREVAGLIQRYGQEVWIVGGQEGGGQKCRGILQYIKKADAGVAVSPLGEQGIRQVLYLGKASREIRAGEQIQWQEGWYRVIRAHPVYSGTYLVYWRGILQEMSPFCEEERGGSHGVW